MLSVTTRSNQRAALRALCWRDKGDLSMTLCIREFSRSSKSGARGGQLAWRPGGKRSVGGKEPSPRGGKGGSSGQWMKRHLKDPYVSAAVDAGAPSRAAFKLVEMNLKHAILGPGDRVLDLGAAPGGWSMVAARIVHGPDSTSWAGSRESRRERKRTRGVPPTLPPPLPDAGKGLRGNGQRGPKDAPGIVVAVDLLDMEALPGVEPIQGDFREPEVEARILAALAGKDKNSADSTPEKDSDVPGSDTGDGDRDGLLYRGWSLSDRLFPALATPSFDLLEVAAAATGRKIPNSSNSSSLNPGSTASEGVAAKPSALASIKLPMRATVVLSDMAPSFTGHRNTDQGRVAALVLDAFAACVGDDSRIPTGKVDNKKGVTIEEDDDLELEIRQENEDADKNFWEEKQGCRGAGLLARGGTFLGKFLAGRDEREIKEEAERLFEKVKVIKPPASRSSSSEMYLLATGFLTKGDI